MKAIVCTKYGSPDDLEFKEVEKPAPKDNEVLVEIHGSSVNYNTLMSVTGKPFIARLMGSGLQKPNHPIPGNDIAGRVEAVGRNVTQFKPGDEVYGDICNCGCGAFAEYVSVPESALALKPANLTFEEAGVVPEAAVVALQGLRDKGRIQSGQKVLIYGASGGIGTFAVQIAKSYGTEVTGVCGPHNLELVRSLGADHVIDYTQEDFTQNGQLYDLILATAGYRSIFDYKRALSPTGNYVATGGSMSGANTLAQVFQPIFLGALLSKTGGKQLCSLSLVINQKDLYGMKELIEAGKVKPVIDRSFPLSEAAEAIRYYGMGHAKGKVAMKVGKKESSLP